MNLEVDFNAKRLNGNVIHSMTVLQPTYIVQFDIWNLDITAVRNHQTQLNQNW